MQISHFTNSRCSFVAIAGEKRAMIHDTLRVKNDKKFSFNTDKRK